MKTLTTNNIKISVVSRYEPTHSYPAHNKYVHSYWIKIENKGNASVKLLSREWIIKDSHLNERHVNGEGVIGKQPVIEPGGFHQYSSWSPVSSEYGQMSGRYKMKRLADNHIFYVDVPAFNLTYPPQSN